MTRRYPRLGCREGGIHKLSELYINNNNGGFSVCFENTEQETPPLYPNITNQIVTKTLRLCNASCG